MVMRGAATARLAVAATRAFSATAAGGGVYMAQGASRGIGLEFVRQLLRRSEQGRVVATCRAPDSATELHKLKEGHAPGRLTVLPLDVADESTIEHMWPLLKVGGRSEAGRGFSLVANMSARVSSIGDNGLGGWHSYRASKTALNQLTKTIIWQEGQHHLHLAAPRNCGH